MKNLILIIFITLSTFAGANASCMLNEPCALPENTVNETNEFYNTNLQDQKQPLNFMPNSNLNIPNLQNTNTYQPVDDNFQKKSAPRSCVFGLCLP